jgi:hypothetical protein
MAVERITPKALAESFRQDRFLDKRPGPLAGRCLLDGVEFLRIEGEDKINPDFRVVVNAHAIRLCWQCAIDLKDHAAVDFLKPIISQAFARIAQKRGSKPPYYGDDFWDWSYVLDAQLLALTEKNETLTGRVVAEEIRILYDSTVQSLAGGTGPFLGRPEEWYGPAILTAIFRLLDKAKNAGLPFPRVQGMDIDTCLEKLKEMACEPLSGDFYRGRPVRHDQLHWHLGQVAGQFPERFKAEPTSVAALMAIEPVRILSDPNRAYALARMIQGTFALQQQNATGSAITLLLESSENLDRAFGRGLISSQVKASLNVLEGLWPSLQPQDREDVAKMLKAIVAFRQSEVHDASGQAKKPKKVRSDAAGAEAPRLPPITKKFAVAVLGLERIR